MQSNIVDMTRSWELGKPALARHVKLTYMLEHRYETKAGCKVRRMKTWHQYALHRHRSCISYSSLPISISGVDELYGTDHPLGSCGTEVFLSSCFPSCQAIITMPLRDRPSQGRAGKCQSRGGSSAFCCLFSSTASRQPAEEVTYPPSYLCITHASQAQLHAAAMISYNAIPFIVDAILLLRFV